MKKVYQPGIVHRWRWNHHCPCRICGTQTAAWRACPPLRWTGRPPVWTLQQDNALSHSDRRLPSVQILLGRRVDRYTVVYNFSDIFLTFTHGVDWTCETTTNTGTIEFPGYFRNTKSGCLGGYFWNRFPIAVARNPSS